MDQSWENKNPVVGSIDRAWDADWYRVVLQAGTLYQIDIRGMSAWEFFNANPNSEATRLYGPNEELTLRDPYLRGIYDQRGDWIEDTESDIDNGDGLDEKFVFTATYTGRHYISVSSWEAGVFDLSVISNPGG